MYATVIVKRDRKKRVVYNSGKVYLRERNSVDLFLEEAEERGLEAYEIRLRPPFYEPGGEGDGYFCPYCGNWEFWEWITLERLLSVRVFQNYLTIST